MFRTPLGFTITALAMMAAPWSGAAIAKDIRTPAVETVHDPAVPALRDPRSGAHGSGVAPASAVRPNAVLYDNGPLVTHPGAGAGGADASATQTALGNSIFGFGASVSSGRRVADDFVVPAGGWTLSNITLYAYQTGSTTTSTIDHINLRIWNGVPGGGGSTVVFGDDSTNVLTGSSWSNDYRVTDTALTGATRPIMANTVQVNTTLPEGTYWLDWQVGGTLASGPWAPPVTILGSTQKPGANGLQWDPGASTWGPAIDTGSSGAQQDFPFVIEGVAGGGPQIALSKTVGTDAGTCAATNSITVPAGTTVYYCYTVTNTGAVAFDTHALTDDVLGPIFSGQSHALAPGASTDTVTLGLTIPFVANATTTNTATWTATNQGPPVVTADAAASAIVTVVPPRCPAGRTEVTLLSEDFEGTFPPAGWTVSNASTNCVAPGVPDWTNTNPGNRANLTGGSGLFAIADSDSCGNGSLLDAQLWTPALDMTGLTDARVSFATDYNDLVADAGNDMALLDFSTDAGATWTNLFTWNEDHRGPLLVEQDFAGGGEASATVRWYYNNATWDWWWQIDDVTITACAPDDVIFADGFETP